MNALKEMLALAEKPTAVVFKDRKRQIPTTGEIADRGNQLIENMFGIEESAKTVTKDFLKNLYPKLNLEPLKWRNKKELPRLVIFSLDSPEFCIRGYRSDGYHCVDMCPDLPHQIKTCYEDVLESVRCNELTIKCSFSGFIPIEIKQKIFEAMKVFDKNSIYIIAEPYNWSVTKSDPLVVAWDGKSLRLIADFDTTGIEEAMIFEPLPDNKD